MPHHPRRSAACGVLTCRSRHGGFTLIELLTVIAIIGILAAIVIPTVGTVRDKAQRAVDSNNLREILKAAQIYAGDNQDQLPNPQPQFTPNSVLTTPQPAWKWPGILAKNNILTDPTFYFSKTDPAFSGTYPQFIIQPNQARNTLHREFTNQTSPSWEFVGGLKMSNPAHTPVIYTRGLQANGTWSATSGVYGTTGGFIAFLGGNVAFYPNTNNPAIFYSNFATSTRTTKHQNVRQAIPFNTTNATNSARIYGIAPRSGSGGMIGTPAGTIAQRGP